MFKKLTAAIFASAAFVGMLEDPAHADPMDNASAMVIAATQCGQDIPDEIFLPELQKVALMMDVSIPTAVNLVRSQVEIHLMKINQHNAMEAMCSALQTVRLEWEAGR